jgi:Tol biopolymer transport system component
VDAENPTFTADGQWIVYNSGNPERRGVWKIRLDGSEDTLLARGSTGWPEASPDGRYALYTFQAPGANSVRVVRLADSQVLPLVMKVQGGGTGRARWMPDGRAIAYVDWDDAGVAGVFVEEFAPGGEARAPRRKLAGFDPERTAESFSVSPDGERITISFASTATNLMLAEGGPGVALPRRR